MNDSYEMDINFKWLMYRVLRSWRVTVVWVIIIALMAGIGSFALKILKLQDPEYVTSARLDFEREHASWVATGENFEAQLANIEEAKQEQQEYNEKSVLMQIDPLREFHASFEMYVDYNYQIMPDMAYQNIDLSDRILKAYATYMTNGELYQYIIDNVSFDIERRYLGEIFGTSVDYGNNMLSVSVRQQNAQYCQEILDVAQTALQEKYIDVCSAIAEHTLSTTNAAAYETVNLNLQETQKANRQRITELDISLQEVNAEYLEWKTEPEPEAEITMAEVIKKSIKLSIIGGLVGFVAVVVIVVFVTILSGKLLNPKDVKDRFGLRIIGELPAKRVKKPFAFVSRWFAKFGGITATPEDFDCLVKMVGVSIKSDLASREDSNWTKIAFTGTVSEEELTNTVAAMGLDSAYTAICAADILTNAESIEKLSEADCVVLVEKQEVSTMTDIAKELEALRAWNKPVLGAVVVNADAVM